MHDPLTVAFDISIPKFWVKKGRGPRSSIPVLTIWHVDPEKDGDDNSCDWHGSKPDLHWVQEIEALPWEARQAVLHIWQRFHRVLRPRPWWRHPKWHIHHWRLQIYLVQHFKRWCWSRCDHCGKPFSWKEAGGQVIGTWAGKGPVWLKNGETIWHLHCYTMRQTASGKEAAA